MMTIKNDWQEFLDTQSQQPLQQPVDVMTGDIVCDLSHDGLIKVSDEEADSFLQNQFCNDVRLVDESHSQLNGYCNPKGRLLAFFRLLKIGDGYYLQLTHERVAPIMKRLQMYVMMSKVSLTNVSDDWVRIGLSGPNTEALLTAAFGEAPMQVNAVVSKGDMAAMRVPGLTARFVVLGSAESIKELWSQLVQSCSHVQPDVWQFLDISAGIPQVAEQTVEAFVPQMLNLQSIDGLSFKKGCYPGQEIVARMHYLGKQKRRMYLAHVASENDIKPGTDIHRAVTKSNENNQSVGTIVSAAKNPSGGTEVLAVMQISHAEAENLTVDGHPDSPISLKDLPYSVEVEGDGKQ